MSIMNVFKNRKFKYGALAISITAITIAVIVILNIIVSIVAARFDLTVDMTPQKFYEISDETIDYVKTVKDDITITVLVSEKDVESDGILKQTNEMIKKIKNANSHIKVDYVDIIADPRLATKYSADQIAAGGILVENKTNEKRYKYIANSDLYSSTMNQQTYQTEITSINSERVLASALLSVTSEKTPKVEVVTGHGEVEASTIETLLTQNNYSFSEINLMEKDIAADTDFLLVYAPQNDFAEAELKKIDTFLLNGEKLGKNLLISLAVEVATPTRLNEFLKEWGIEITNSYCQETDQGNMVQTQISQYPLSKANVTAETASKNFKANVNTLYMFSRELKLLWEGRGDKKTEAFVQTGSQSIALPIDDLEYEITGTEETAARTIVASSTQTKYDSENNQLQSTVTITGGTDIFEIIPHLSSNNSSLLLNLFNSRVGIESPFEIIDKSLEAPSMDFDESTANILGTVLMAIIPLGLIVWGIVVWLRRKSL